MHPKNTSLLNMGVEKSSFGGTFQQRGQDDCTVLKKKDEWGHVSSDFGQQPSSLSQSIEDESWLELQHDNDLKHSQDDQGVAE